MRRVVFNQKGGVGKSSIVCNLAAMSAAAGLRTLVIDLDPQGNATQYLLGRDVEQPTLHDFFEETLTILGRSRNPSDFVHRTPWPLLDILPANVRLQELQPRLESRYKIFKLREALPDFGRYQAVYMDTPPAMNFFTLSALIAADRCLIPFDCDAFSRRALDDLLVRVREIVDDHNENLEVEGIVINQYQPRARLPRELVEQLRAEKLPVIDAYIGQSVKLRESHQANKPLLWFAPRHKLTDQFRALFAAIEDRAVVVDEVTPGSASRKSLEQARPGADATPAARASRIDGTPREVASRVVLPV